MSKRAEWDYPPRGRRPAIIEGRIESERVVYQKRVGRGGRQSWEDQFWTKPTVARICHGVFRFGVNLWKVIIAGVLTLVIGGCIWFMAALFGAWR